MPLAASRYVGVPAFHTWARLYLCLAQIDGLLPTGNSVGVIRLDLSWHVIGAGVHDVGRFTLGAWPIVKVGAARMACGLAIGWLP